MLMNTRYIIGIRIVHSTVITCRSTVITWRCICITWHGSGHILLGKFWVHISWQGSGKI